MFSAYNKNRFIGEGDTLISDIVDICDCSNIGKYLLTIDIENEFYSRDHKFILDLLNKIDFGKKFVSWIEALLNNQQSCVINSGITARYFPLQRDARQGDPMFILYLKILFILIKNDPNIKGYIFFSIVNFIQLIQTAPSSF